MPTFFYVSLLLFSSGRAFKPFDINYNNFGYLDVSLDVSLDVYLDVYLYV